MTPDTAHQAHLHKFIKLGTWQTALLHLGVTKGNSKVCSWVWLFELGKARIIIPNNIPNIIIIPNNRGAWWGKDWEGTRKGGRGVHEPCWWGREESELSSQRHSHTEKGSSIFPLPDLVSLALSTNLWWLLLNPTPALSHTSQQTGQAGAQGKQFLQGPLPVGHNADNWRQDKGGLALAVGLSRGQGSSPCLGGAAKQDKGV